LKVDQEPSRLRTVHPARTAVFGGQATHRGRSARRPRPPDPRGRRLPGRARR